MSSAEAARNLVADLFGSPVGAATRMTFGHGCVTYRVETAGTSVIVRTNADPSAYAGTVANIDRLRALGLPVPTVLAVDLTCQLVPFAYVITDTFPGRDLGYELAGMSRSQMSRLAEQIVGFERRVTGLPAGRSFGFRPIGADGPHRRWIDAVRADRPGPFADVHALLDRLEPRLDAIGPVCFLDDLTVKNVMVYDGVLQGVVDFDVVCYGDPMYWLALTQVGVLSDVGEPGRFYVDELIRLWHPTDFERANLGLYSALHATAFLSWDVDDHDRHVRLSSAIRSWIAEAEN